MHITLFFGFEQAEQEKKRAMIVIRGFQLRFDRLIRRRAPMPGGALRGGPGKGLGWFPPWRTPHVQVVA